eukprot:4235958-Pleurochrysis_carterae.AAC.1
MPCTAVPVHLWLTSLSTILRPAIPSLPRKEPHNLKTYRPPLAKRDHRRSRPRHQRRIESPRRAAREASARKD